MFYIAQAIGLLGALCTILSSWQKDRSKILLFLIFDNIFFSVQYLLWGAYIGALTNGVCLLRTFTFRFKNKNKFFKTDLMLYIIIALHIIMGIIFYDGVASLFPVIASVIFAIVLWQENAKNIRIGNVVMVLMWFVYNLIVRAYVSALVELTLFICAVIGVIKIDIVRSKKMKKQIQIGVMGSDADLNYSKKTAEFAKELGKIIAKNNDILVYGAEKHIGSLSTIAAEAAKKANGITVGITYGKTSEGLYGERPTVLIPCGLEIGGGREFTLVLACDVIIAISGGSGTLNEIAVAYQANKPIIVVDGFGGWSEKLSDQFLDDRKRLKCISARTPQEAYEKAVESINERNKLEQGNKND